MSEKKPSMTNFIVSRAETGMTIQQFLAKKLNVSNRGAKNLLDNKQVWVNLRAVWMAHHALKSGDAVEVRLTRQNESAQERVRRSNIRILFQDGDYLIADKPTGILSVGKESAEKILQDQIALPTLQAVHRLDKETSGCLLFAKNPAAWEAAVSVFKTRQVKKIYQTIVWGRYERDTSTIRQSLDGENAVSHIRKEMVAPDASFLRIRIETGRTHQIRRHMAMIRYPVLGDRQYGFKTLRDPRLPSVPRIMLHACELEMPHPTQPKAMLKAHSPLPVDFRRCLKLFDLGK